MNPPPFTPTARALGLLACRSCGLVLRPPPASAARCPRCGSFLHSRKPHSLVRTTALLIAAYILIIPANILPVMETGSLFGSQKDTILSGVVYLWVTGSWPLAILVFFASIVVPLVKLMALSFLVVSVRLGSTFHPLERARLYHLLEFIGRWSMLDIYVVTLLTALVRIQTLATVTPGPGAVAFGAVVVLTMLAAMAFDPRLIWDSVLPAQPSPKGGEG